jgi:hypothetical protein
MPYAHPQPEKVLKYLMWVCHGHGMQFERFYSLNQSIVAWFSHLHQVVFHPTFPNMGMFCGGNDVNMKPYAHPQPEKVLKHLIHVYH